MGFAAPSLSSAASSPFTFTLAVTCNWANPGDWGVSCAVVLTRKTGPWGDFLILEYQKSSAAPRAYLAGGGGREEI
jgi:hypothetical protein